MEGTIAVSKTEQFTWRIIEDYRAGRITRMEAATLLVTSEKTVQRLAKRCREKGLLGLKHGNALRNPHNLKPLELRSTCLALVRRYYFDFNLTHALEMLRAKHGIEISYSVFRRWCVAEGLGKRKRRRSSKDRVLRERFGNEGLLLQMDGSHHKWNGKDDWFLIAAIDDATSDIPHAEFFKAEDTINCMKVLRKIIEYKGVPEALYVDRAGWFGGMKRQFFSQFVRACDEVGVRVIYANSPQAKGRIERAWRTFQDRLIPEMRLHGITTLDAANQYTQNQFIPNYWSKQNIVAPKFDSSRYRELNPFVDLDDVFCMKYVRKVRNDQTVYYDNVLYRLKGNIVGNLRGKEISIIERSNGKLDAYYGHIPLEMTAAPHLGKNRPSSIKQKWSA